MGFFLNQSISWSLYYAEHTGRCQSRCLVTKGRRMHTLLRSLSHFTGSRVWACGLGTKAQLWVLETVLFGVSPYPAPAGTWSINTEDTVRAQSKKPGEQVTIIPHSESPQGAFICLKQGQHILKPSCHSSSDRSGVGSWSIVDLSRDDVWGWYS